MQTPVTPNFNFPQCLQAELSKVTEATKESVKHKEVLTRLLEQLAPIDFRQLAGIEADEKICKKHYLVISIEQILQTAHSQNWALCKQYDFIYIYNGSYWAAIDRAELESFLGVAAERIGIDRFDARIYTFREQLYRQFLAAANMPKPEPPRDTVFVNLLNGTFEITPKFQRLRQSDKDDFITYQLPFEYNPKATAPIFEKYLNKVQPDKANQAILAEYIGYLFVKTSSLKLEKTLLLYGEGANGKSVFFDIVTALLGEVNVSNFSLQNLTDANGYYRAMLANKILNYATEISGKLNSATFKQLVSGEPVEARLPHCNPFVLTDYAKLIFNCNELPKDVEHNEAFFRRFLIVPFDVTLTEAEREVKLANRIIQSELSGVFNWVLSGLNRLLKNESFTHSESVKRQIDQYRLESDSVGMFLKDENYMPTHSEFLNYKDVYADYKTYCKDNGYYPCSAKKFSERIKKLGYQTGRKCGGIIIYAQHMAL
ncbi:MAG TPA: phage/plasmid primase, P4 family [Chitinophagales bacterium]|nr:phage/plasmid primase, P4 family [Chitinophagales bacterium]